MRGTLMALAGALPCIPLTAHAVSNSFSKTVPAGRTVRMTAYHSWDPSTCASLSAKMTVKDPPKHGALSAHVVTTTITATRIGNSGVGQCLGHPIKALQIDYKSAAGYRGPDAFTIEVAFGYTGRTDLDTFSLNVQ